MYKTLGLSPKAVLAFLFPLIATVIAAVADWVSSGQFEVTAIRTAVAGLLASGLALLGAYVGKPGAVVPDDDTPGMTEGVKADGPVGGSDG